MMSIGAVAVAPSAPADRVARHRRSEHATELELGRRRLQVAPTAARRGRTWDSRTPAPSRASWSIRRTRTSSTSPRRDISGGRTPSVACSRRPTAARRGRRCCSSTRTPARPISSSTRPTRRCSTRRCISASARTWGFNGGGPGLDIYKTIDGGATWTKLTTGLPAGDKGRIGLSLYADRSRGRLRDDRSATRRRRGHLSHARRAARPGRRHRRSTRDRTTTRRSASTRATATTSTRSAPIADSTSLMTAGRRSRSCSATCTARTTRCGSIPTTPNHLIIGGDGGISISLGSRQDVGFPPQHADRPVL